MTDQTSNDFTAKYEAARLARKAYLESDDADERDDKLGPPMDAAEDALILSPASTVQDIALKVAYLTEREDGDFEQASPVFVSAIMADIQRIGGLSPEPEANPPPVDTGALPATIDELMSLSMQARKDYQVAIDATDEARHARPVESRQPVPPEIARLNDVAEEASQRWSRIDDTLRDFPVRSFADLVKKARFIGRDFLSIDLDGPLPEDPDEAAYAAIFRDIERLSGSAKPSASTLTEFLNVYADLWMQRLAAAEDEHSEMLRFACEMVKRDMDYFAGCLSPKVA